MLRWLMLVLVVFTITIVIEGGNIGPLNVCGPDTSDETLPSLVFVSTLDGNLHALDLNNNGEKKWSVDFNYKPMLSSSIHSRELNNEGHWVRLVPSLSGGLYKFDGENLEALPVTPQQLLRSSFRYSDDLVLSGSGETHTYGVASSSGKILYHCHEGSCTNMTENESFVHDVLVVRRFQDTVRAAEPRTGQERWNYSVGQHELELIPQQNQKCNGKLLERIQEIDLKVNVPEGIIWAIDRKEPRVKLWEYKVESPIVAVWREHGNQEAGRSDSTDNPSKLSALNLFENTEWDWGSEFSVSPSLYIGMHDRQLYIQENSKYVKQLEPSQAVHKPTKTYPWRPYPASETSLVVRGDDASISTALSVLYNSEFINGNGFFLHSEEQELTNLCNHTEHVTQTGHVAEELDDFEDGIVAEIVSLSYWWKEIVVLVVSGAILLNYIAPQRVLNAIIGAKQGAVAPLIVERHIITKEEPSPEAPTPFVSRYLTDFDPIDCLGKGGYGVVFEARKKIDHVNYAVKRITLPNNKDARERVMREVRALANLDHQNIVRYFHAWLECPPAGWKEQHDEMYINGKFSPSEFPSEVSMTPSKPASDAVCIDLPGSPSKGSIDSAFEAEELNKKQSEDSSFIVFEEGTTEESAVTEEIGCEDDSDSIVFRNSESSDQSGVKNKKNNSFTMSSGSEEHSDSIVFKHEDSEEHSESIVFQADDSEDDSESIVFKNDTTEDRSESIVFKNDTTEDRSESIVFKNDTTEDRSESIVFKSDSAANHSESIVFKCENTDDRSKSIASKSSSSKKSPAEDLQRRKRSLSLNLKEKTTKKGPRMFLYIQMQLCHRESLREWLKRQTQQRNPDSIQSIFQQIIDGVEYVHLHGLIHRDLKPSNIFFSYDKKVKIGDFGLATGTSEGMDEPRTPSTEAEVEKAGLHTAHVGTHLYMAPEQMNGQIYNYKVDIYSLGIILFELLTPFTTDMERMVALMNLRKSVFPPGFEECHPRAYELLKMMLDENPARRPTTLGIKARPPLAKKEWALNDADDSAKFHFELPQLSRHSSVNTSSSDGSWDISSSQSKE